MKKSLLLTLVLMAMGALCTQAAMTATKFGKPAKAPVTDITVTPADCNALVSWTGDAAAYNLRYRVAGGDEVIYFNDFEESLDGWSIIDFDEDGNNWGWVSYDNPHSGEAVLYSASWTGELGSLDPDNWVISPQVELRGTLKFWVRGASNTFKETFDVLVGTELSTASFESVLGDTQTTTTWTEVSIDLSSYQGQLGYIAIRHYNCPDNMYMFVDDFGIYGDMQEGGEWTTVENVTSPYLITGLDPKVTYEVEVQPVNEDWSEPVTFTTINNMPAPTALEVTDITSTTATAQWQGLYELYNLRFRTAGSGFFEDFENGLPADWTIIDANGDGYTWKLWDPVSLGYEAGSQQDGNMCMTSPSYQGTAITPDDYLVTPAIELGGTLSFLACGQDPSYAAEHFAVYVSTTGTEVADFVELMPETETTGTLTEYTADLSAYEGQTGYIAFRHFNCNDEFRLNLDNVAVVKATDTPTGEWIYVENVNNPYALTDLEPETTYEVQVQATKPATTGLRGLNDASSDWSAAVQFTTLPDAAVAIDAVKSDVNGTVRYYDISGHYVGTSLDNAPAGLYIGSNGKKVVK